MKQKNGGFVSEIDQFLQAFDQAQAGLSESQKKEKAKYQRINYLRKTKDREAEAPTIDDWFK